MVFTDWLNTIMAGNSDSAYRLPTLAEAGDLATRLAPRSREFRTLDEGIWVLKGEDPVIPAIWRAKPNVSESTISYSSLAEAVSRDIETMPPLLHQTVIIAYVQAIVSTMELIRSLGVSLKRDLAGDLSAARSQVLDEGWTELALAVGVARSFADTRKVDFADELARDLDAAQNIGSDVRFGFESANHSNLDFAFNRSVNLKGELIQLREYDNLMAAAIKRTLHVSQPRDVDHGQAQLIARILVDAIALTRDREFQRLSNLVDDLQSIDHPLARDMKDALDADPPDKSSIGQLTCAVALSLALYLARGIVLDLSSNLDLAAKIKGVRIGSRPWNEKRMVRGDETTEKSSHLRLADVVVSNAGIVTNYEVAGEFDFLVGVAMQACIGIRRGSIRHRSIMLNALKDRLSHDADAVFARRRRLGAVDASAIRLQLSC